jgi:hypothetical protein
VGQRREVSRASADGAGWAKERRGARLGMGGEGGEGVG